MKNGDVVTNGKHPFPYDAATNARDFLRDTANMSYEERLSRTIATLEHAHARGGDDVLELGPAAPPVARYALMLAAGCETPRDFEDNVIEAMNTHETFRRTRLYGRIAIVMYTAAGIIIGLTTGYCTWAP